MAPDPGLPNPDSSPRRSDAGETPDWRLFHGDGVRRAQQLPPPPSWRRFARQPDTPAPPYVISDADADVVTAALRLRRPLLVTGNPGTGKSSLAEAIAQELDLGDVLTWPVNSRSTLAEGLYSYDAIGRLQQANLSGKKGRSAATRVEQIGDFVRLGPLGTAMADTSRPRVLLVDELDKGDIDLPNDLLSVLEYGEFEIVELSRLPTTDEPVLALTAEHGNRVELHAGRVHCTHFPVVVITSNGEREFPAPFRRRCVPMHLWQPTEGSLRTIVESHLGANALADAEDLIEAFLSRREEGALANDQLLNAVFLRHQGAKLHPSGLLQAVLHQLDSGA